MGKALPFVKKLTVRECQNIKKEYFPGLDYFKLKLTGNEKDLRQYKLIRFDQVKILPKYSSRYLRGEQKEKIDKFHENCLLPLLAENKVKQLSNYDFDLFQEKKLKIAAPKKGKKTGEKKAAAAGSVRKEKKLNFYNLKQRNVGKCDKDSEASFDNSFENYDW